MKFSISNCNVKIQNKKSQLVRSEFAKSPYRRKSEKSNA